jgi:tetratricopeptide (TPR) repeat protein
LWYCFASHLMNGRPAAAIAPFASAAEAFLRSGDMVARGFALTGWAYVKTRIGDLDQAVAALDEVETIVMQTPADNLRAMLANRRWALHHQQGDMVGAEAQCRQALALYRKIGSTKSATAHMARLAAMAWDMGRLDEALEGFSQAVAAMRQSANVTKGELGVCLTNLAGVHIARGEYGEALVVAREGMALREEAGYVWGALDDLAVRAAHIGRAEDAARIAGRADEAYRERFAQRNHSGLATRAQLQALLEDRLGPVVVKKLLAEGAAMTMDQACALALAS